MNESMRAYRSKTRAAGGSIKSAWGAAKRNPRIPNGKKTERAKRAIAQSLRFTHDEWLPPTSRALPLYSSDPGVPLRSTPGFDAVAALRGLIGHPSGCTIIHYDEDIRKHEVTQLTSKYRRPILDVWHHSVESVDVLPRCCVC